MAKPRPGNAADPQTQIQQALALHRQGNLLAAEAIYADILRVQPTQFDALYLSGLAALQAKRPERAADLLSKAARANPKVAAVQVDLGAALFMLKRFDAAVASFDKALALQPDNADARNNRVLALRELIRATDAARITPPSPESAVTAPAAHSLQDPFAVAVVMPTLLRPTLLRAAESVFAQQDIPHGQLLIGIDKALGDRGLIETVLGKKPPHWAVTVLDLGYSTSVRHGGVHAARDGGALRTILSYSANSRYVAYLDDDNWWAPDHLSSLLRAIQGRGYAWSQRWFVDPQTLQALAVDVWESVGPEAGIFQPLGGFVDPNTLMIDKVQCEPVLRWWSQPLPGDATALTADRSVFRELRGHYAGICTRRPTCYYVMNPDDDIQPERMAAIRGSRADRAGC